MRYFSCVLLIFCAVSLPSAERSFFQGMTGGWSLGRYSRFVLIDQGQGSLCIQDRAIDLKIGTIVTEGVTIFSAYGQLEAGVLWLVGLEKGSKNKVTIYRGLPNSDRSTYTIEPTFLTTKAYGEFDLLFIDDRLLLTIRNSDIDPLNFVISHSEGRIISMLEFTVPPRAIVEPSPDGYLLVEDGHIRLLDSLTLQVLKDLQLPHYTYAVAVSGKSVLTWRYNDGFTNLSVIQPFGTEETVNFPAVPGRLAGAFSLVKEDSGAWSINCASEKVENSRRVSTGEIVTVTEGGLTKRLIGEDIIYLESQKFIKMGEVPLPDSENVEIKSPEKKAGSPEPDIDWDNVMP